MSIASPVAGPAMTPDSRSTAQRSCPTLTKLRLVPAGASFVGRRAASGRRYARTGELLNSGGTPIAFIVGDGSELPVEHAEPEATATPSMSRFISRASPST